MLRGEGGIPERDYFYWEFCEGFRAEQAVRMGRWKALRDHPARPTQLYDVNADPGEQHDLAAEHPETVARAEELFEIARTPSPVFPNPGEDRDAWHSRMEKQGLRLPINVDL